MRRLAAALLLAGLPAAAPAQTPDPSEPPPIEDNSFLVEEAYNQDARVVQHIQSFIWSWRTGSWSYTFTQEWPVGSIRNQLSYTLLAARVERENGRKTAGLGDVALNYRYQLVGDGEANVAVAPRLSLLLPAGDWKRELGFGAVALQTLIPVSIRLSSRFVAHGNAGVTWIPRARDPENERADLLVPLVGGSVIWLARPTFNVLCEAVWLRVQMVSGPGLRDSESLFTLNPGGRYAWNSRSGLQVVAGASTPLVFRQGSVRPSLLLYLSFEHPF